MIIDSHVHITPPELIENTEKYRKKDKYFDLLSGSKVNKFTTADDLIVHMDENNIDKSVVFGFAFKNMELCRLVNDYTMEMVEKYPERLIAYAVVNPTAEDLEEELERCKKGGLKGIGELFPEGQDFDLKSKDEMKNIAKFCINENWPLLVHINEPIGHYYCGKTDDSIEEGAVFAENFPELTIIFAHLGGGLFFYELMPEMKDILSNVYYDTAAQPYLFDNKIYEVIKSAGLENKILLGSDYPLISAVKYYKILEETSLSSNDIAAISGNNYANLLNI